MKEPFKWDYHSKQPYQLKDKLYKKEQRSKNIFSLVKTALISLLVLPFAITSMPFARAKEIDTDQFFAMGIDIDDGSKELIKKHLDELDVKTILIRFPLWKIDELDRYIEFLEYFNKFNITLNVMQDREHIDSKELCKKDFELLFSKTYTFVNYYQIGTTINRAKWGFFSVNEYLDFYKLAYDLKLEKFNDIKLIGSNVIDFEFHFTIHTLFNFSKIKYDAIGSLLYVDRRGAPENTQLGFDLNDKISFLSSVISLSPKKSDKIFITETNWPLSGTAPYAPTSEKECVSEESYAIYMLRYYLLSFSTSRVDAIYWHELFAKGFGLVDEIDGFRKMDAFYTFKFMKKTFSGSHFMRLDIKRDKYSIEFLRDKTHIIVTWSLRGEEIFPYEDYELFDFRGKKLKNENLKLGEKPIYMIKEYKEV